MCSSNGIARRLSGSPFPSRPTIPISQLELSPHWRPPEQLNELAGGGLPLGVIAAVAAGLLTKTSATDDQRRCVLVLSDLGREALARVTERRRELVAETIADWPESDVDTLVTLLDRLTEHFERAAGG